MNLSSRELWTQFVLALSYPRTDVLLHHSQWCPRVDQENARFHFSFHAFWFFTYYLGSVTQPLALIRMEPKFFRRSTNHVKQVDTACVAQSIGPLRTWTCAGRMDSVFKKILELCIDNSARTQTGRIQHAWLYALKDTVWSCSVQRGVMLTLGSSQLRWSTKCVGDGYRDINLCRRKSLLWP